MNLSIQFKEYLSILNSQANQPLRLQDALIPFGITGAPKNEDPYLLVGHLLDGLSLEFLDVELIDASDVLRVAEDLGANL